MVHGLGFWFEQAGQLLLQGHLLAQTGAVPVTAKVPSLQAVGVKIQPTDAKSSRDCLGLRLSWAESRKNLETCEDGGPSGAKVGSSLRPSDEEHPPARITLLVVSLPIGYQRTAALP